MGCWAAGQESRGGQGPPVRRGEAATSEKSAYVLKLSFNHREFTTNTQLEV